ncbi:MAG: heparinase II/III family protein, partial [Armatimonadota bacterium]|nr:heparinase II/III family protein [Armatimonadota bacterium]
IVHILDLLKRHGITSVVLTLQYMADVVQDYLWNICEETNWVVPAHESMSIDLFAAETGFMLAEALQLLGDVLDQEVQNRVREEVERRIFTPFFRDYDRFAWARGPHNWNGVCNSSTAATFLLLQPGSDRTYEALEMALGGLAGFLKSAFEEDGTSTEGVGYWHYGLINFVALSEMLRARSRGAVDLLAAPKLKRVAAYPAKLLLSGSRFAAFSDCPEEVLFNPGILARLALRTGEESLLDLLAPPAHIGHDWRLPMMLRNLLWWDGRRPTEARLFDAVLEAGGVARLVSRTPGGVPVVLAVKAGHNAEHHNQNDVGSFVYHVGDETLLVDPGRGLYTRFYFGPQRYHNVFAGSYGHSVPRVNGAEQAAGREHAGKILSVVSDEEEKRVEIEFARAYPVPALQSARRRWILKADGTLVLEDAFQFAGAAGEVEEAFVTWGEVEVEGGTARVRSHSRAVALTVVAPAGVCLEVERLEEASRANKKPGVLKRIRCALPAGVSVTARFEVKVAE